MMSFLQFPIGLFFLEIRTPLFNTSRAPNYKCRLASGSIETAVSVRFSHLLNK